MKLVILYNSEWPEIEMVSTAQSLLYLTLFYSLDNNERVDLQFLENQKYNKHFLLHVFVLENYRKAT